MNNYRQGLAIERRQLRPASVSLNIKRLSEDERILEGIATAPSVDLLGDIVEPRGAQFTLPIPLLWQHERGSPVGKVTKAKVTDVGIQVTAQIARITEPGALKDSVDRAWQAVRAGLVTGLSIGFSSTDSEPMANGGRRFKKWRWHELSLVTIAAQPAAAITGTRGGQLALKTYKVGEILRAGSRSWCCLRETSLTPWRGASSWRRVR